MIASLLEVVAVPEAIHAASPDNNPKLQNQLNLQIRSSNLDITHSPLRFRKPTQLYIKTIHPPDIDMPHILDAPPRDLPPPHLLAVRIAGPFHDKLLADLEDQIGSAQIHVPHRTPLIVHALLPDPLHVQTLGVQFSHHVEEGPAADAGITFPALVAIAAAAPVTFDVGVFVRVAAAAAAAVVVVVGDAGQEAQHGEFGQEGDEQAQVLEVLELGADGQLFEVRAGADDAGDVVGGEPPLRE